MDNVTLDSDNNNNNNMEYNVDYDIRLSKARQEFNALLNSHLGRYFTRYVLIEIILFWSVLQLRWDFEEIQR